jgi:hypothetical protein
MNVTDLLTQSLERFLLRAWSERVDLLQHRESVRRNPAQMLPPILRAPLPANESLGFEAIEQPRDAWRLFDHPRRHLEGGQPVAAGAAQDAQDVELLDCDARGSTGPPRAGG